MREAAFVRQNKDKWAAFENALINKVREGNNHIIRYKAFLTLSYLKNQNEFDSTEKLVKFLDVENQNEIFTYLENKLKADQLAAR